MGFGRWLSSHDKTYIDRLREECNLCHDEIEIFNLLSKGHSLKTIGKKVSMSERTVSRKIENIRNKSGWKEKVMKEKIKDFPPCVKIISQERVSDKESYEKYIEIKFSVRGIVYEVAIFKHGASVKCGDLLTYFDYWNVEKSHTEGYKNCLEFRLRNSLVAQIQLESEEEE